MSSSTPSRSRAMSRSFSPSKYGTPKPPPKSTVASGRPARWAIRSAISMPFRYWAISTPWSRIWVPANRWTPRKSMAGAARSVSRTWIERFLVDTERRRLTTHSHRAALRRGARIDPHRDRRARRQPIGDVDDPPDLAERLGVDLPDALLEHELELGVRLAGAREQNPRGRAAGSERAVELTGRGDLEVTALRQKVFEQGGVRVGLDRIGDRELGGQRRPEQPPLLLEDLRVVDVERCPVALGQHADRHAPDAQLASGRGEVARDQRRYAVGHAKPC